MKDYFICCLLFSFVSCTPENKTDIVKEPSRTKTIEEVDAIKTALHAMKIEFEVSNEEYYNPEFVAKIEKSRQDFKDGKGKAYTTEQLNALWK